MYTKRKNHYLTFVLAFLLGALGIFSPQIIQAEPTLVASEESTATVIFEGGDITLDQVVAFNFGTHAIAGTIQKHDSTDEDAVIQISDLRGTAEGWDLNVSLSAFTLTGNSTTLNGAYIEISDVLIAGVNGTVGNAPAFNADETLQVDADETETSILKAEVGDGSGVWSAKWSASDAKLVVPPGSAQEGTYTADLTWSLQSTP